MMLWHEGEKTKEAKLMELNDLLVESLVAALPIIKVATEISADPKFYETCQKLIELSKEINK